MRNRPLALLAGLAVAVLVALACWWHWGPIKDQPQEVQGDLHSAQPTNAHTFGASVNEPDYGKRASDVAPDNSAPVQPDILPENKAEPDPDEPPTDSAKVARNLEIVLKGMIQNPTAVTPLPEIAETFLELQDLGQPGIEAAARLFLAFEKRWGLGSGDLSTIEAEWRSVAGYMSMFSPKLITWMVERRADFTTEACGLVLLQNISHKPDWKETERLALAITQLESEGEGEIAEYRRMAATQALMRMPSVAAAEAAAKFLQSGSEPWLARTDAVWTLARVGRDQDFDVIRWVELNDKELRVRQAAEFHRQARGVTEPGFLIQDIKPHGTATETTLRPGDIVRWVEEVPFKFNRDVPESFDEDQSLRATRQGQSFDVVLPKGMHGLKLGRVPPAFPD